MFTEMAQEVGFTKTMAFLPILLEKNPPVKIVVSIVKRMREGSLLIRNCEKALSRVKSFHKALILLDTLEYRIGQRTL